MANFTNVQITNLGRALQAKAQAGAPLVFTRFRIGSGTMSGQQIADMTNLITPVMWLNLNKSQASGNGRYLLGAHFSNSGVTTGFYFREWGVFAQDPDVGEILYCYGNVGAGAEYIPAEGSAEIVEQQLDMITLIGNAMNVSATLDESLLFATKTELDAVSAVADEALATANAAWEKVDAAQPLPINVVPGTNIVEAFENAVALLDTMEGNDLLNLLGRDGNCESIQPFGGTGTLSLDTSSFVYGSSSLKVAIASGSNGHASRNVGTLRAGEHYLIACKARNVNSAVGVQLGLGGNYSITYAGTSFSTRFVVYTIPSDGVYVANMRVNGNVGEYGLFDGIRLYRISAEEKAYIESLTVPAAQEYIDARYPYTEGFAGVFNPYVVAAGKNLLLPFYRWRNDTAAEIKSPYELDINATENGQYSLIEVDVLPNTTYSISCEVSTDGLIRVGKNDGTSGGWGTYIHAGNGSFTTDATTSSITVLVFNNSSTAGRYTFKNPMLNVGPTALPFEPQNRTFKTWKTTLRKGDKLVNGGTQIMREQMVTMWDGTLGWEFGSDYSGYKIVRVPRVLGINFNGARSAIKYDGKVLTMNDTVYPITAPDIVYTDGLHHYISIADADSGWGEDWTSGSVTQAYIKAFMNGWKYIGSPVGSEWRSIGDNTTTAGLSVASSTLAPGFTPYQLKYTLATPTFEEADTEGDVLLFEGLNQLEVGAGLILHEGVVPNARTAGDMYGFNNILSVASGGYGNNPLKYTPRSIFEVYRNEAADYLWIITTGALSNWSGGIAIYTPASNFDPTSAYSASYFALDLYKFGFAPRSLGGSYAGNLAEEVAAHAKRLAEQRTLIDMIRSEYARKQQPGWITPQLLNAWTNFSSNYYSASFRKNEFNKSEIRGMVKGGTGTIFILPIGYRPSKFTVRKVYSSLNVVGTVEIRPTGEVRHVNGDTTEFTLDGISFDAEQ